MVQYYLLAAICCVLLLIAIKIWVVLRARRSVIETNDEENSFILSRAERDIMLRKYDYDPYNTAIFPDTLLEMLKKVNRLNPNTRQLDAMDEWFKRATPKLMHNGKCLSYIDHYGHLEDMFWKNVSELNLHPEQDKKFQMLLFSCHYVSNFGYWHNNFSNMLFHFGGSYGTLLPEVEEVINKDNRLKAAKGIYYRARGYAKT